MKDNSSPIDRLLALVFVIGLVALALIYGAAAVRYRLPLSQHFANAFLAAEAWYGEWKRPQAWAELPAEARHNIARRDEHIISHPRTAWDKTLSRPGYTLITTGYLAFPYLVDMEGRIVHRWNIPVDEIWPSSVCINPLKKADIVADSTHLFPNGDLLVSYADATFGAPYGCGIVKADKDGNVLWVYKSPVHHDFTLDAGGNIYVITQKIISTPPAGLEGLAYPMADDVIVKLSPDGVELDSFSLLEAFRNTPFELWLYHDKQDGDFKGDFFHANSVDILPAGMAAAFPMFKPGQLLVSARSFGALAVIDPETKKTVWVYRGFWSYQHAASFLPSGRIMLLDNLGHTVFQKAYSRIVEFDPATLGTTWHFAGSPGQPFLTDRKGRVQRLPDGNTLITEFGNARLLEVTRDGKIAWEYALQKIRRPNEFANGILDATRYGEHELLFLEK